MCHAVRRCYCHYDWSINYASGHFSPCLRLQGHGSFCLTRLWKPLGTSRLFRHDSESMFSTQLRPVVSLQWPPLSEIHWNSQGCCTASVLRCRNVSFKGQIPSFVFPAPLFIKYVLNHWVPKKRTCEVTKCQVWHLGMVSKRSNLIQMLAPPTQSFCRMLGSIQACFYVHLVANGLNAENHSFFENWEWKKQNKLEMSGFNEWPLT